MGKHLYSSFSVMNEIKAVFDIGNNSIKAVVFQNDNGKDVILAQQEEASLGLKKGKILDAERFTTTINKIVENFSKKLGGDFIENVVISLSHPEMIVSRIYESKIIFQELLVISQGRTTMKHLKLFLSAESLMKKKEKKIL